MWIVQTQEMRWLIKFGKNIEGIVDQRRKSQRKTNANNDRNLKATAPMITNCEITIGKECDLATTTTAFVGSR
jgi:Flp pilus assembly protein TadG